MQSTIHEVWARKYSGALKQDLRYSPSKCFDTFAFPAGQWQHPNPDLAAIGEAYHEHRRELMLRLWLGLTDIYNLFHARELDKRLEALFKRRMADSGWRTDVPEEHRATAGTLTPEQARDGILRLRALHVALDQAVLAAYGWHEPGPDGPAIALAHDFQELETLPENDRTRYTITPAARKDLLARLLKLNHARAAEEAANAPATKGIRTKKASRRKTTNRNEADDLFGIARKEAETPASDWMDQPLVLPKIPRFAWDPAKYRAVIVPQLLHQAGDKLPFERFRRAYWLLTEPSLLAKYGQAQLGSVVSDWQKVFCDELRKEDFIPHLESAIRGHLHLVRVEGKLWIERTGAPISPDPHIQFDARIALFVADLWPANEPIKDLLPTEQQRIKILEAVI